MVTWRKKPYRCPKFPLVGWFSERGLKLAQKSNRFHDDRWYTKPPQTYLYQKDVGHNGNITNRVRSEESVLGVFFCWGYNSKKHNVNVGPRCHQKKPPSWRDDDKSAGRFALKRIRWFIAREGQNGASSPNTSGWWFGTWHLFFHILGRIIIPIDSYFSEG